MISAMKSTMALLFLLPAISALGSCSDQEGTAIDFPANAETDIAAAAESSAATEQVNELWLTEFQALATGANALDALAVFESLKADQPELLTSENLLKMTVYAIEVAKSIELTQPILDYAITNYPKEIGKFGGIDAAIFRLQNPSVADLPLDGAHAPIEGNAGAEADALIESAAGLEASGTEEG